MFLVQSGWVRFCLVCILTVFCALPLGLMAETGHVVSPSELQAQAAAAAQARQQNVEKVRSFLSGPAAAEALKKAKIDAEQVKNAVAQLNNQELADLAARADKAQRDFAAGDLSTRDIALIILGVAVLILIIVAVR
ncbi:MAG TPA: PA2779 family protein [Terriglobales bacterium]|nr:PA2779 family protein [Terriglobales bacterium]